MSGPPCMGPATGLPRFPAGGEEARPPMPDAEQFVRAALAEATRHGALRIGPVELLTVALRRAGGEPPPVLPDPDAPPAPPSAATTASPSAPPAGGSGPTGSAPGTIGTAASPVPPAANGAASSATVGPDGKASNGPTNGSGNGSPPAPAAAPTAEGLAVLRRFEDAHRTGGIRAEAAPWELFADAALRLMTPAHLARIPGLDAGELGLILAGRISDKVAETAALRTRSARTAPPTPAAPQPRPLVLPPEIAGVEDLTARVRAQPLAAPGDSPFDGERVYQRVFDSVARTLHRRTRRHIFLVGERGVGMMTVLSEFARLAIGDRIAPFLKTLRFVRIDARHCFPEESRGRLAGILSAVAERDDLVVCLEGLAGLLRGERGGNRPLLLSFLPRLRCRLIALLTPREFEDHLAGDDEVGESFSRIEVPEPDPAAALALMRHFSGGLEAKFGLTIEPDAVRSAVTLTSEYVLNDRLPGKALKVLHRVCEDADYERTQRGAAGSRVAVPQIIGAVSELTGVPPETLRGIADRADYERSLGESVFGQAHAIREVATELGLIKAGMTDRNKPASVMLFAGQTGTGKTELAKALARFYSGSKRLRMYTLGNFTEPHSVAGLIGVPPGYVGNDQGGRLINDLNADPYGVFLLDEIDKAHPDVLQPFLNLFDEGWVVDQRGVKAHADRTIFILTTNAGQGLVSELSARGADIDTITERVREALTQIRQPKTDRPVFTPEFLARIKRIIVFAPLGQESMTAIARRLTGQLAAEWRDKRDKHLIVDMSIAERIGALAHARNVKSEGREGGRLVRRMIAECIEAPLQRRISDEPATYRAAKSVEVRLDLAADSDERTTAAAVAVDFHMPPRTANGE